MRDHRRARGSCAVLAVLLCAPWVRAHETSDSYLRNVVSELRLMNEPLAHPVQAQNPQDLQDRRATAAPRLEFKSQVAPRKPQKLDDLAAPVLGFSPSELAAMYTRALEQGTPVKFVNTFNHQMPNIVNGRYELTEAPRPPPGDPQYAYYFYPLHTFHRELPNQLGYRIAPNFYYDSVPAKSSKKEINAMNPILVGIGSFMGMALFFLFSLFIYPRFMHFMHFPLFATSRTIFQNELTNLAAFVTEAIEYYNKTVQEKSKRSPFMDSMS